MKKKMAILLTMTLTVMSVYFVGIKYYQTNGTLVFNDSREKMIEDALIRLLFPYITDSIAHHYGQPKQYYVDKIIEITRSEQAQYHFTIKVRVVTFEGPHNPPYGTELITITMDSKIYVSDYEHKDGVPPKKE